MRILFLIRTLKAAGAQRQLVNLAIGLKKRDYDVSVAVFYSGDAFEKELVQAGIPIYDLKKESRWDVLKFILTLLRVVKKVQPEIIHGYDGIPNCLALFMKLFDRQIKTVWGVRASFLDLSRYDLIFRLSYKLECLLSRFADLIIANSNAGFEYAVSNGFPRSRMRVIHNGIDIELFKPDKKGGISMRQQLGISDDEFLIGLVGRIDPMKDHPVFIDAMQKVSTSKNNVRGICLGDGSEQYMEYLKNKASELGLDKTILWVPAKSEISGFMNAIDILVSSSYGEGFPNVIGEAMACGTPCVVTDVGDSALIVGECGFVVPPRNSNELGQEIIRMLDLLPVKRNDLAICARERITEFFRFDILIDKTEACLNSDL